MNSLDRSTHAPLLDRILQARENRDRFLEEMRQRQQKGQEIARHCARVLKEQFGARRVVLFGSLLDYQAMSPRSDIDLAVWGLPEKEFFRAGAAIERGHDFSIDLVEAEKAKPRLRKAIEKGIEL